MRFALKAAAAIVVLFAGGWLLTGSPWGGALVSMVTPILFAAGALVYGFIALAPGFTGAGFTGFGIGAITILGAAMRDELERGYATFVMAGSVVLALSIKAFQHWRVSRQLP